MTEEEMQRVEEGTNKALETLYEHFENHGLGELITSTHVILNHIAKAVAEHVDPDQRMDYLKEFEKKQQQHVDKLAGYIDQLNAGITEISTRVH
jgi:hypothetical protein